MVEDEYRHELVFEKAYCLYRLERLESSLEVIDSCPSDISENFRIKMTLLKAQVYYKSGDYYKSLEMYRMLIKRDPEYLMEIETNYLASTASLLNSDKLHPEIGASVSSTGYEILFNSACLALAQKDWSKATELLQNAIETLEKDSMDPSETEKELLQMKFQTAFALFKQNKTKEAVELWDLVANSSAPKHLRVLATANSSILNKFSCSLKGMSKHLLDWQRNLLQVNQAVISSDSLKSANESTQKRVLQAILLLKQGHLSRSVQILEQTLGKYSDSVLLISTLTQILVNDGKLESAKSNLHEFISKNYESLVSAGNFLVFAIYFNVLLQLKQSDTELLAKLQNTSFKIQIGQIQLKFESYKEAAATFQQVLDADSTDLKARAGLIRALSHFDEQKMIELTGDVVLESVDFDVENISNIPLVSKHQISVQKRKRKRVNKPPKKPDPRGKPDPERWIPKKQRKAYLKKHKGKKVRGSQGQVAQEAPVAQPAPPVQQRKKKKGRK